MSSEVRLSGTLKESGLFNLSNEVGGGAPHGLGRPNQPSLGQKGAFPSSVEGHPRMNLDLEVAGSMG